MLRAILAETAPDVLAPPDRMLATLARKDLSRAVDALWAAAMHTVPASDATDLDAMAEAALCAVAMVRADPRPAWVTEAEDDDAFVDELLTRLDAFAPPAAPAAQTFGTAAAWGHLKEAATRLAQSAVGIVSDATRDVSDATKDLGRSAAGAVINPMVRAARPGTNKNAILFLGDILAYLATRGEPRAGGGPIVRVVTDDLERAAAGRSDRDPMIIVAHSMGGIISYDILAHFRPGLVCDLFVTVGSQVGVMAGLGLLAAVPIDRTMPSGTSRPKAVVPDNIRRWINVFDPADVLGFKADRVFDRVEDYAFSSGVSSVTAHSMYFERPHFYERLRARIAGAHP